jgi:hypothetical protein
MILSRAGRLEARARHGVSQHGFGAGPRQRLVGMVRLSLSAGYAGLCGQRDRADLVTGPGGEQRSPR